MNTPESREGNVIRYAVYLIGYVMVFAVVKLVNEEYSHLLDSFVNVEGPPDDGVPVVVAAHALARSIAESGGAICV